MDQVLSPILVEGVGSEVVYVLGTILFVIVPLIITSLQRQNYEQVIHPESEENVQNVREEIQHQRETVPPTSANGVGPDRESQAGPTQRPIRANHGDLQCPVCLADAQFAVQTNCSHIFCGNCIITYWRHGRWLGAVKCPVCRQTVTLLLINFTHEEHNIATEEKRAIVDSIYQYNRRFSGEPRSWREHLRDLPTLLRHAFSEFFTVGGLVWMFRLRILVCFFAALLYFISPFDIIPEAVFGILGLLDDVFVLLLLAIYVALIYRQVVQNRANAANNN